MVFYQLFYQRLYKQKIHSRYPFLLYLLHFVNIGAQTFAFALFYYEDVLYEVEAGGILVTAGSYPVPLSFLDQFLFLVLGLLIALVNVETLQAFSVLSDGLTEKTIRWYRYAVLAVFVAFMTWPAINYLAWIFSGTLPSFYSDSSVAFSILELLGYFFFLLQDNVQNTYLLLKIYKFNPNTSKPEVVESFRYTIILIVALIVLDVLGLAFGIYFIKLIVSVDEAVSNWPIAPIVAFLGLHAVLLDVLFKRFKRLVVFNGSEARQERFALERANTVIAVDWVRQEPMQTR